MSSNGLPVPAFPPRGHGRTQAEWDQMVAERNAAIDSRHDKAVRTRRRVVMCVLAAVGAGHLARIAGSPIEAWCVFAAWGGVCAWWWVN